MIVAVKISVVAATGVIVAALSFCALSFAMVGSSDGVHDVRLVAPV